MLFLIEKTFLLNSLKINSLITKGPKAKSTALPSLEAFGYFLMDYNHTSLYTGYINKVFT